MSLSRREQVLFVIAAFLVACFLAYAFAILPAYDRYRHEGVLIRERKQRLAVMERKLARAGDVAARYKTVQDRVAADRGRNITPMKLFADIQALAGPMGVSVTGVDPLPIKENPGFVEQSVLIDVEAPLGPLADFLYEIENSESELQIQRLAVSPVAPGSPALRSQIQVSARMFRKEAAKP